MKTNHSKFVFAASIVASLFTALPTAQTLANNTNPVAVKAAQPTINVKVIAQQDEFVILQIDLSQTTNQNSKLLINDEKGLGMYEETVNTKTFSRKIKVAPSEMGKLEIVFSTPTIDTKKTYAINVALVSKVDVAEVAKF